MVGERVRSDDGIVGVVQVVLPSRSLVRIIDNANSIQDLPLEVVSVIDGERPSVYL
jgi:hypothetical protein